MTSCTKEENDINKTTILPTKELNYDGAIGLGEQLNDPYRYENMQAAFQSLLIEDVEFPMSNLSPTGTYVRALAHDKDEMWTIEEDTTIAWFLYPLDYEIETPGSYYVDPTLPDTTCEWLYGVIPIGYAMPSGIVYEVLYQVCIPDEIDGYKDNEEVYDLLEERSMELTGNIDSVTQNVTQEKCLGGGWRPSATLQVWDSKNNTYVPLQGIRVDAHTWCKTATKITDASGFCEMDRKFYSSVQYSFKWERVYWQIVKQENTRSTMLTGPKQTGRWILNIYKNRETDYVRATIHRAALQVYYSALWTIERPIKRNLLGGIKKMLIRYKLASSSNSLGISAANMGSAINGADIEIAGRNNTNVLFETQHIFAAAIHELAQWSHRLFYGNGFHTEVSPYVSESWAICVEWYMTTHHYPNLFGTLGYMNGYQNWTTTQTDNIEYTPVFVDLMDSYNQGGYYNNNQSNDNISGYTLKEIQDNLLEESYTKQTLLGSMKSHKLHGATDTDVDNLMNVYINNSLL